MVLKSKEYFGIIQGSDVFAADWNLSVLSGENLLLLLKTWFIKEELIAGIYCENCDFEVILKKKLEVHLENQHGDI